MKVAFIFAHPDDESFGPAGTITELSKTNEVRVISLCKGNRPGSEEVSLERVDAFTQSTERMGAQSFMYPNSDCALTLDTTIKHVEHTIEEFQPDIIYTHNINDLHKDHQIVAEAVLVASRPKTGSTVKELYMCEIPAATDWAFGEMGPVFQPNVYIDVTKYMNMKKDLLRLYQSETYRAPDGRSVAAMETLAAYRGKQAGMYYAEGFRQIFRLM